MLEIIFESQKLRNQIPLTDEQLMVQLDRIGIRPYQFDLEKDGRTIILRLSYELLKQIVHLQELGSLTEVPVLGTAKGQKGHVLCG